MKKYIFSLLVLFVSLNLLAQKKFTIDFSESEGMLKNLQGVNKGPEDKLAAYKDAGISIIRTHDYHAPFDYEQYTEFWNITSSDTSLNTSFDPTDPNHYHWDTTDAQLTIMQDNGFDVFFRLGISNPDNTNYPTPPIDPPYDHDGLGFDNFAEVCKRTVMHTNDNWAGGFNMGIKYWEIWNEPGGLFWDDSAESFYLMYNKVANTLKSFDSTLRVGAVGAVPTTSYGVKKEYRDSFLQYCADSSVPLDFYSWHHYSAKNPYSYKMWGDSIQRVMEKYGFSDAENIISECNYSLTKSELSFINNNPVGTAYYLASLICTQKSHIDKLFWYTGLGKFDEDIENTPQYNFSGYALKFFGMLKDSTPISLQTTGSEYIATYENVDTTNMVIIAGKSADEKNVYFAVTNIKSDYSSYDVEINNLPWTKSDNIKYTKIIVSDTQNYKDTTMVLDGDSTITLRFNNKASPSTVFVQLQKNNSTGIKESESIKINVYPNPVKSTLYVNVPTAKKIQYIKIITLTGNTVIQRKRNMQNNKIDISGLKNGVYLVELQTNNKIYTKMIVKN